jgi:hypothetical protein
MSEKSIYSLVGQAPFILGTTHEFQPGPLYATALDLQNVDVYAYVRFNHGFTPQELISQYMTGWTVKEDGVRHSKWHGRNATWFDVVTNKISVDRSSVGNALYLVLNLACNGTTTNGKNWASIEEWAKQKPRKQVLDSGMDATALYQLQQQQYQMDQAQLKQQLDQAQLKQQLDQAQQQQYPLDQVQLKQQMDQVQLRQQLQMQQQYQMTQAQMQTRQQGYQQGAIGLGISQGNMGDMNHMMMMGGGMNPQMVLNPHMMIPVQPMPSITSGMQHMPGMTTQGMQMNPMQNIHMQGMQSVMQQVQGMQGINPQNMQGMQHVNQGMQQVQGMQGVNPQNMQGMQHVHQGMQQVQGMQGVNPIQGMPFPPSFGYPNP